MSKPTDENVMTVKPSKFEKITVIVTTVLMIILTSFGFWFLGSSNDWLSKKEKDLNKSIERSERMHKEYLDTIKASTSNIVEAIKSTNK